MSNESTPVFHGHATLDCRKSQSGDAGPLFLYGCGLEDSQIPSLIPYEREAITSACRSTMVGAIASVEAKRITKQSRHREVP
jgi:hypothetical protein